ncbi:hypothetical protein WEI85_28465 [Actinomycetes bacterium KLBMP 9797]
MTTWIVARTALRAVMPGIVSYWAIMLAVVSAILIGIAAAGGQPDISIWSTSGASAPKYFLFALGIAMIGQFPVYIGHGLTRREFARGALLYFALLATIYGATMALGFAAERPVYVSAGLMAGLDEPYPVQSLADGFTVLVEESLVGLSYLTGGWLIGMLFYRLNSWWGIVILPFCTVPILATEMGFDSLWAGLGLNNAFDLEPPPLGVGVLIAVAAIAVMWSAIHAFVRTVPINKVSG